MAARSLFRVAARCAFAALLFLSVTPAAIAQQSALAQKSSDPAAMIAIAQQQGYVRVIVLLDAPALADQVQPGSADLANVRRQVAAIQAFVIDAHFGSAAAPTQGSGFDRSIRRFDLKPGFAVNVTSSELERLAADARITRIQHDRLSPPSLVQSVPLIGMTSAYASGAIGTGQAVAVLDTGVKANHEFLVGKVVAEGCFSNSGGQGMTLCPNGMNAQAGAGASNAETAQCLDGMTNLCDHGSHVAGIAAGNNTGPGGGEPTNGVAKGAPIFSIQVFTRFTDPICASLSVPAPCVLTYDSDQITALDHVLANINLAGGIKVASVNMSLGGGNEPDACDFDLRKNGIDNLRAAGILTAISSGNGSLTNGVGAPGCISSAVTVGSSTKADAISDFSNMSAVVDLMAPGSSIQSSIPPGNTYAFFNGTSMAAPHVAGAIAAIRSACPNVSASSIETALKNTGTPITDNRIGGTQTKPRIRVDLALDSLNCAFPPGPPGPVSCVFNSQLRDFNADGRADIFFRRNDGLASIYFMNGAQIANAQIVGTIGTDWQLVGINDFNGDGRADLMFRRPNGQLSMYLMNGANIVSAQIIGTIGADWNIVGVGDFNGDGRADFVTRRTGDGMLAIYFMNGFQILDAQLAGTVGLEWKIQGMADFNGSGRSGILFRRTGDGTLAVFLFDGAQIVSAAIVGAIGTDWTVVGVGDFNGDGRADFVTRRGDGTLGMYLLNGTQLLAGQAIGVIGIDWTFVAAGDLNGDGKHDMVFRRTTGVISAYLLNGFQIVSGQIAGNLGTDWNSCYGQGNGLMAQKGE